MRARSAALTSEGRPMSVGRLPLFSDAVTGRRIAPVALLLLLLLLLLVVLLLL